MFGLDPLYVLGRSPMSPRPVRRLERLVLIAAHNIAVRDENRRHGDNGPMVDGVEHPEH